jgi:hypothetical protein
MKRLLFAAAIAGFAITAANAQKLDDAKTVLALGQYKLAKDKIDKAMGVPKEAAKAESHIAKSTIYGFLISDSTMSAQAAQLAADADAAYVRYAELDPKMALVKDPLYTSAPISLYTYYYNEGYKIYQSKNFGKAGDYFAKAVDKSQFIVKYDLAKLTFDTTLYTLAGDAYQRNKQDDKAAPYFKALADKKLAGDDFMFLYSFLMTHYFERNMSDSFAYYRGLGQELYPKKEYFTYTEEDFILDMKDNQAKFKRLDAKMAAEPNNTKLQETYGLVLFDLLSPKKPEVIGQEQSKVIEALGNPKNRTTTTTAEGKTEMLFYDGFTINFNTAGKADWIRDNDNKMLSAIPLYYSRPANYVELEQKMTTLLEKSAEDPAYTAKDNFYLGNFYLNKGLEVTENLKGVSEEIKAFNLANKPKDPKAKMPPVPKELLDKRVELNKTYDGLLDKALPYLEKSAEAYGKMPTLTSVEKNNFYKKAVDQVSVIYGDKKNGSKVPADKAKYEAAEKKWNAVYSSIH